MGINEEIREAIQQSSKSRYRIWQETGVSQGQLSEFMAGTKRLSVRAIEEVADCLGLEVTTRPVKRTKVRRKGR